MINETNVTSAAMSLQVHKTNCKSCSMGALTNSGRISANFTDFYKAFQSAAAVIIWRVETIRKPSNSCGIGRCTYYSRVTVPEAVPEAVATTP